MTKFYIATAANDADALFIDAIGTTAEEAIADAQENAGDEASFAAHECTPELYAYVKAHGTPERWTVNAAGLHDLEVEEIVE